MCIRDSRHVLRREDSLDPGVVPLRGPGVVRARYPSVGQVGQGLTPGQGGPLTLGEERGLAPCRDGVQPHLMLTARPGVTGVHRQAVGTVSYTHLTLPTILRV